jgi:hypothetical protein
MNDALWLLCCFYQTVLWEYTAGIYLFGFYMRLLVTGSAEFIGYQLAKKQLGTF